MFLEFTLTIIDEFCNWFIRILRVKRIQNRPFLHSIYLSSLPEIHRRSLLWYPMKVQNCRTKAQIFIFFHFEWKRIFFLFSFALLMWFYLFIGVVKMYFVWWRAHTITTVLLEFLSTWKVSNIFHYKFFCKSAKLFKAEFMCFPNIFTCHVLFSCITSFSSIK